MKKISRMMTIAAVAAALCLLSAPAAMASTGPGQDEPGDDAQVFEFTVSRPEVTAPTGKTQPGDAGSEFTAAAAIVCQFTQRVDYVHISSSAGPRAVQSHGNWANENCNYALADVTTQIDKRNILGFYYAVGVQGKGRLAPNPNGLTSGGAGRVTARYECNGTGNNSFRSWTDVDIVGYADATNKVYSPAVDKTCG